MSLTRRELLTTGAVLALGAAAVTTGVLPPFTTLAFAADTNPSPEDLAHAGPAGDVMIGSDKAPVTIIEYASMTCPHCAHFDDDLPGAEEALHRHRQGAFHLPRIPARSAGRRRLHAGALRRQGQIRDGGRNAVRQTGRLGRAETDRTADGDRQAGRLHRGDPSTPAWRIRRCSTTSRRCATAPLDKFGVNSTPTFFINGKMIVGDMSIEDMAKEIDPYLKS